MTRSPGVAEPVDPVGHDAQRVDVEAGIGLVENRQRRLEHGHLENFVPLLLAAGKSLVDGPVEERGVDVHQLHPLFHEPEKVDGVELLLAAMLPDRVEGRLQEVGVGDAGDFDRVLEGEEDPLAGPLLRRHGQEVLALVADASAGDLVGLPSGEDLRERALARPVRPHDGMDLAEPHLQVDPLQNFVSA